ncbi:hypothetical protein [Serratia sp. DD3]|uniref:hypothetical protein n=1 Tax=Serratia sp. DD3 TaxID=1410619 RepID=UPI0003C507E0|nr:hypothetical protein [Serratia sp. DD3]KEY57256.1 hypothetical protein SRDD_38470 [Serratia sp. DD3]
MSEEKNNKSQAMGSKSGSIFGRFSDSLREAIFEVEPKSTTANESPAATETPQSSGTTEANGVTSIADNPMVERLHQAVLARATVFRQLISNMTALEKVLPDEAARLQAAFAVLKQNGASVANLQQEIELHMRDLETQELRFREEAASERKQRIDERQKVVAEKQAIVEKAQAEIERQQQLILTEQAKMADLSQELKDQTAELDRTAELFSAAFNHEKEWLLRQKLNLNVLGAL